MKYRVYNLGGKQLRVSPILKKEGELLRSVNFYNDFYGAKTKRPGYVTFLGTADGNSVDKMWSWTKEDGTSTYVYRQSGTKLQYWEAHVGTATAWTTMGNGTITASNKLGNAVLADTMIISQVGGTTRHTTNGTSLTDTIGAPRGELLASYQNRIHIGSASTDFWSAAGSGTDWNLSGTSDSSSQTIPGPGKINGVFIASDRINWSKNSGNMFRWDGYSLRQLPTNQGPSSPYSIAQLEDATFFANRKSLQMFSGDRPTNISEPINRQMGTVSGDVFDSAPGIIYDKNYHIAVGTVTDDLTSETISNDIVVYDYNFNQFFDYSFASNPTAWTTYKDKNGDIKLVFGDSTGQCYTYGGTATSDNGAAIEAVMEGFLHFNAPELDKHFRRFYAIASPGCCAKVQVAVSDSFTKGRKKWMDVGQFIDGVAVLQFPVNTRGKFLFWRVAESSASAPFTIYGFTVDYEEINDL